MISDLLRRCGARALLVGLVGVVLVGAVPVLTEPAGAATAVFSVDPSIVDFGSHQAGTASDYRTVTVTNTSDTDVPFTIDAPTTAGFEIDPASTCLPRLVPAHGSCQFQIRFVPNTNGSFFDTILLLHFGEINSITLKGTGFLPQVGVSVSPTAVDLGTVVYPGPSGSSDLTITNTGDSPEVIDATLQSGGFVDWLLVGCRNVIVQPSLDCTASVQYSGQEPWLGLGGGHCHRDCLLQVRCTGHRISNHHRHQRARVAAERISVRPRRRRSGHAHCCRASESCLRRADGRHVHHRRNAPRAAGGVTSGRHRH